MSTSKKLSEPLTDIMLLYNVSVDDWQLVYIIFATDTSAVALEKLHKMNNLYTQFRTDLSTVL